MSKTQLTAKKSTAVKPEFISVLIPVFNEAENVDAVYNAIVDVLAKVEPAIRFEILFTDNRSTDDTFNKILTIAETDSRVKALRFSRNYGFQRSLLTAYRNCQGDAAIQIDADLQDSPTLIPQFIEKWREGADVVYGIRAQRQENLGLKSLRQFFYYLLNRISDERLPAGAGDFRLTDRSIIEQLRRINDQSPYVRGLISSFSRSGVGIAYRREKRQRGTSKFPIFRLTSFAINAIIAHSILPLRIATFMGLFTTFGTLCLVFYYVCQTLLFGVKWPDGLSTLVLLLLMNLGLTGVFVGIVGEYVGRLYLESRDRPTTIVTDAINIEPWDWLAPPQLKSSTAAVNRYHLHDKDQQR